MALLLLQLMTLSLIVVSGWSSPVYAKQSGLAPARSNKQITQTLKNFDACRKEAITLLKQGPTGKRNFTAALSACKETYPGADLYITCKKQAMQAALSARIAPDLAVNQCRHYLVATTFLPNQPFPLLVDGEMAYFAGIGLNRTHPAATLTPPNFDCHKIKEALPNIKHADYSLIGNHPELFSGLAELKAADLVTTLKLKKPTKVGIKEGIDVAGFGRLFYDPRKPEAATVYFPAAACNLQVEPGPIYSGLSTYYLLDQAASTVTPYFAIAYYRKDQKAVTTANLIQKLNLALGSEFKVFHRNDSVTFIAAESLPETDDEHDPKNLCRQPRPHQLLGIIQAHKDKLSQPEYLILANIKNLCEFGDRLAKRL
ncbi:MAG: hypothetical protein NTY08_00730 [Proteobacteria bacterium]|nr:hypothetical protein [Pseudomonadota bacterium]